MIQEHVQHAAGEAAEKFKAGEVIIEQAHSPALRGGLKPRRAGQPRNLRTA